MKIIVPILVVSLAVIIILGVWMNSYLKESSDRISAHIKELELNIQNGDWQSAHTKLTDINENWDRTSNIWYMMVDHDEIDSINNALAKVEAYIKSRDNSNLESEIASLKLFVEHVPEREAFALRNIF